MPRRTGDDATTRKKAGATRDAGKTTRTGGAGSKFPRKGNGVGGTAISSATRATAGRARKPRGGSGATVGLVAGDGIASSSDFASLYERATASDPPVPDDGADAGGDGGEGHAWADADWPAIPGGEDDVEGGDDDSTTVAGRVIGEEARDVAAAVAGPQEQAERNRFKGVTVDPAGETVLRRGQIHWVPIARLINAHYNPRAISPEEMANLKQSLDEFGMPESVVVNTYPGRENVIVGGHQRTEAARQLGWEEVPCTFVYVNPVREKVLNLALNRISGRWDEQLLAQVMAEIEEEGADLAQTGFSRDEIDEMLAMTAGLDDTIDLGDEFDSEHHRAEGAAQIIILIPADQYDPFIGETIDAAVASLKVRYPALVVQRKGGA